MGEVTTIGLDIAKTVFQAHGADASGAVVFRKKLSRSRLLAFFASQPPCLVAMAACAGSHHWGRELTRLGHTGPQAAHARRRRPGQQDGARGLGAAGQRRRLPNSGAGGLTAVSSRGVEA